MSIAYASYRTINYSPWRLSKLQQGATPAPPRPTWTLNNSSSTTTLPTVSSVQFNWGTTSALFNGTSNTMAFTMNANTSTAQNNITADGLCPKGSTSAWTFEMWIWIPTSALGTQRGFFDGGPGGVAFGIRSDNKLYLGHSNITFGVVGNTALTGNTWFHIVGMTSAGSNYLFRNGVLDGSGVTYNYTGANPWNNNQMPAIGPGPGASLISAYVQDIRISNGAIYPTTGFSPPTGPLTNLPSTRLLVPCYNGVIADNPNV